MSNGVLSATGIAVTDLRRSEDFWTRVVGMERQAKLRLPEMDEVILGFHAKGASLVLMQYTDGRVNVRDLPVKVVVSVDDPASLAAAIRAEGLPIEREPEPVPELGDAIVGFASDPDGYRIEILERPPRPS
jgi:lactoylglutathione lyase